MSQTDPPRAGPRQDITESEDSKITSFFKSMQQTVEEDRKAWEQTLSKDEAGDTPMKSNKTKVKQAKVQQQQHYAIECEMRNRNDTPSIPALTRWMQTVERSRSL